MAVTVLDIFEVPMAIFGFQQLIPSCPEFCDFEESEVR